MALIERILQVTWLDVLLAIFALYFTYGIGLGFYRIHFHPLSKFPGPKLAAATLWYEFYFDVVKRGRFAWEIRRMHEVYGSVVRINPYELHVDDPDFYDELYTGQSRKRNKYKWSADMFLVPGAMISTVDHDLHRRRRAPLAPYFSLQAIRRFEPVIRAKLDILDRRLGEYHKSGQVVNLDVAFTALTTDIITQYAYGISHGYLEADGFNPDWQPLLMTASEQSLLTKQMPWLIHAMRKIPLEWLLRVQPEMASLMQFQAGICDSLNAVIDGDTKGTVDTEHSTIFHGLLQSGLPPSELTPSRLQGEAQTVVAAGTLTTAHFLKVTMYHILANPSVLRQLSDELKLAMPIASVIPPFAKLNHLTYLNAVIHEGFRLSHGVIARLTRVAPDEDLSVGRYVIPAGTPIGMSSWLIHLNPSLFPSPDEFCPQRWLEPNAERLKKFLVNFTKGSRMCLGKDLARTEIIYTLFMMVRKWSGEAGKGMELFETSREDADIAHDFFNPFPESHSKGVRVLLKK